MQIKCGRIPLMTGLALGVCAGAVLAKLPTAPSPLFDALDKGDAEAVHRIEDQLNAHAATRALDDAQLRYDLPNLLELAVRYEEDRLQKGAPPDLLLALRANEMARASALSMGDANTYLRQATWARKQLLPALTRAIGGANTFDNGLDTADLEGALQKAPKMSVTWKDAAGTLPLPRVSAMPPEQAGLKPSLKIGDRTVDATILVDAATFAPIWIATAPGDSKPYGLTLLVKNIGSATASYHGHSYSSPIDLYLAPSVEFGPLVLHDVAVAVVQSYYIPPKVVIGLPMLRHFGEVTFGDDRMTLARVGSHACQSGAPLSFASGPDLNGSMLFPASIGGNKAPMDFVSDSPAVVAVKPGFSETISDGAEVDVAVGAWSSQHKANVPSPWTNPRDAVLGDGVLKQNTVSYRFDTPTPSICIAKATHG